MNTVNVIDKIEIPKNEYVVLKTLVRAYKKMRIFSVFWRPKKILEKGKLREYLLGRLLKV